jgi:hypothetical protein
VADEFSPHSQTHAARGAAAAGFSAISGFSRPSVAPRNEELNMFDKFFRKELAWGGSTLILETGKVARQADGAVVASYGDTVVLATVVGAKSPKPGLDFFPV